MAIAYFFDSRCHETYASSPEDLPSTFGVGMQ
jgi:hypothetical protein